MKNKTKLIVSTTTILIITIFLVQLAISLSFTSNPTIDNAENLKTNDNIVCRWELDDVTQVNVTWYKNFEVFQELENVITNFSTISYTNTQKLENWTCAVIAINDTSSIISNVTVNIKNSNPSEPILLLNSSEVFNYYQILEDKAYEFYIFSEDPDNDALIYSITDTSGRNLCSQPNPVTGQLNCLAHHSTITGSATPSSEQPLNYTIRIRAEEELTTGFSAFKDFIFEILPYNDQAVFKQNMSNAEATAGIPYELYLNATDEELNYPLVFSIASNLTNPSILIISNYNDTVALLTFNLPNGAPTNLYEGFWIVSVNVTDSSSSNATRPPSQMNFTLEIIKTNDPPYFISNFTQENGTQNNSFESFIYAEDLNDGDILNFSITNPGTPYNCNLTFPWSIETIDGNSSSAEARISLTLNNTHVACRYVNVTVSDGLDRTSMLVFFNITNVNDEPEVYENSIDGDITDQSTYLFQYYSYIINASDIDSYTYDAANTGILYYSLNDTSIFDVSTDGVIYGYPVDELDIGNYSIEVTVTDNFVPKYLTFNIEILGNNPPTLEIQEEYQLYQNRTLYFDFNSTDVDNHTMTINFTSLTNFTNSNYSIYTIINETGMAGERITTWRINLSRQNNLSANEMVGNHLIQVNITDELNGSQPSVSTGILNITINNVNDAPFFQTVTFSPYVNRVYTSTINATDYDFLVPPGFASEALRFVVLSKSADVQIINFTNVTGTNGSASLSFVGTSVGLGKFIELAVYDNYGANATMNVTFEVKETTTPPVIHSIMPYFNSTTNQTVYDFANTSLFSGSKVNINFSENLTVVFDAIASNDTHPSGINYLTYTWYIGNESVQTIVNASPGLDSNLTYEFDFFSNGTYNVTLQIIDYHGSSTNWTWMLNVSNVNRPPFLQSLLNNLTGNAAIDGTVTIMDFFRPTNDTGFYDYDTDVDFNLIYSVVNPEDCSFVTFTITGSNLNIAPFFTGYCVVSFMATDKAGAIATSNEVHIQITGVTEPQQSTNTGASSGSSDTRTRVITVPFEEEVEVPAPIKLIAPGQVDTYVNKTIQIPIKIQNTWTEEVRGISLSGVSLNATFYNDANATLEFEQNYFPSIPVNGVYTTMLIVSNYRTEGPFEIVIYGKVMEPEFTDSVSILINSLEQTSSGDAVKSKVTFAKDMISENPECRELNDLLIRAERAIEGLDYTEALNLVNGVINGCKYLVNKREQIRQESPSLVAVSFDFVSENAENIVIVAAILTLLTVLAYTVSGIKKMIQEKQ